jgi:hypothetical protein
VVPDWPNRQEELLAFPSSLDRYLEGPAAYTQEALQESTALAVVERLLRGAADLSAAPCNSGGCLMVQGALACGEAADSVRQELTARRAAGEAALSWRFQRAKSEGDLPANVNPADLVRYVATILYGMAVQASGGASRDKLQRVVEMTLQTLPLCDNPCQLHASFTSGAPRGIGRTSCGCSQKRNVPRRRK